jgi:hypothetical protein
MVIGEVHTFQALPPDPADLGPAVLDLRAAVTDSSSTAGDPARGHNSIG